jgi:hypothetical protein
VNIRELICWPVTSYRLWRVQRWVLRWRTRLAHRAILPNNVIVDDSETAADTLVESVPRWVQREQNTWIVILVGLFALLFIWERRKRDRERAELASRRAATVFDAFERFFPRRTVVEEFGDAREEIEGWARKGELQRVRKRTVTTILRALKNVSLGWWDQL